MDLLKGFFGELLYWYKWPSSQIEQCDISLVNAKRLKLGSSNFPKYFYPYYTYIYITHTCYTYIYVCTYNVRFLNKNTMKLCLN